MSRKLEGAGAAEDYTRVSELGPDMGLQRMKHFVQYACPAKSHHTNVGRLIWRSLALRSTSATTQNTFKIAQSPL